MPDNKSSQTAPTDCSARQRVLDACAHRQPKRVPFSWGFGPTAEMAATVVTAAAPG